jgi:site-specific DNA recombinase
MSHKRPTKKLLPGSCVVAYVRDSGGNKQELSVIQQKKRIEEYCQNHGFILIKIFEDLARSGTSTNRRDDFEHMLEYCRQGNGIDGLILWNMSRFARNVDDAQYYKSDLRRRGIVIQSVKDEIPEGRHSHMVEVMIDVSAEEESDRKSEDSIRGLSERTEAGYVPGGGTPPRGYRATREIISYYRDGSPRIGTKWEIDSETGPLVTLAFQMRAQGRSINEIMKSPCGALYKTKGCWTTFFRNKSYLGIGKCGQTAVPDHHPALVDQALWDAVREVQERVHKNKPGNLLHPKRYHSPSLLSGIAVCIHCGTPIIREVSGAKSSKGGKWISYVCGKKRNTGNWGNCEGRQIQAANADRAIINAVLRIILQNDYATELINQVRSEILNNTDAQRQENTTRQALSNCEKAISRLLDTIESSDSAMAKERLKERESERARLQFDLSVFESRRQVAEIDISPEALALTLAAWRGDIEEARDRGDIRRLQNLLRRFVTKIELGYEKARIWYTFPIDAFTDQTRLNSVSPRDRQE